MYIYSLRTYGREAPGCHPPREGAYDGQPFFTVVGHNVFVFVEEHKSKTLQVCVCEGGGVFHYDKYFMEEIDGG